MLRIAQARVVRIVEQRRAVQVLDVVLLNELHDGKQAMPERAVFYLPRHAEADAGCASGDVVLLNTTAVRLGLGTGGYHFVMAKLAEHSEAELYLTDWGHIVKQRYTPYQLSVDAAEEEASPWHELFCDERLTLEQTPVVIAELHSMLPVISLALQLMTPGARVVYVMPDGAALPIAFSRHVEHLRRTQTLSATVTAGQAWGGDYDTVNLHTGLLAAKHLANADVIVCLLGPGVVGTGTVLGFSGMQLAEIVHTVTLLRGIPVFVPRISFSDPRERHYGISHHTRTVLKQFTLSPALVPWPQYGDWRDGCLRNQAADDQLFARHHLVPIAVPDPAEINDLLTGYPEPVETMGRSYFVDPSPFQAAYVAAKAAARLVELQTSDGAADDGSIVLSAFYGELLKTREPL